MDLKSLKYFVAAVETGSITGAAARCFIAQPSISAAILKLEDELSVTLLVRQKRGVITTEAGQGLYESATQLLNHAQSIKNKFTEVPENKMVCIEVSHTIAFEYLEKLINVLQQGIGKTQIKVVRPAKINSEDKISEADIRLTMEQTVTGSEEFIAAWKDRYCLIIPSQHPLAHVKNISISDLHLIPFINRSFCERSQVLTDFLVEHDIQLDYVADVDNEEWALSMVESGLGLSIVPLPEGRDNQYPFKVLPLGEIKGLQEFERRLGVAIDYSKYTDQFYRNLADQLKLNAI